MFKLFSLLFAITWLFNSNPLQAQSAKPASPWWTRNNLRTIQMNLPAYEAAHLHADTIVQDLLEYSANTLIINAGGIMAFYHTQLPDHFQNPYAIPGTLGRIVQRCHDHDIKVIVRFDFSRADESIFARHPDWFYISPTGERINNAGKYVVSINAPYVQEKAFEIVREVLDSFPVDGIFLNMPGYQTSNAYEGIYMGIDQNSHDRRAFMRWSGGLNLPLKEDKQDSVFLRYEIFKQETIRAWSQKLHATVKTKSPHIAICTYLEDYVDIIRHESQTHGLPYWPYTASDNVNHIEHSFPEKIVSNASIQQISFRSRYNAVEPEETAIRYWENLAHGSGTDVSLMGDMRQYEDERNFPVIRRINNFHRQHERYYGQYRSVAKVGVVAPGYWPGGTPMQEYRGLLLMLNEAHIPYDIIQDNQLATLASKLTRYQVLILPDIYYLTPRDLQALVQLSAAGIGLLATNKALFDAPAELDTLFGARMITPDCDGSGYYLRPDDLSIFTSFSGQTMVHLKYNLAQYVFNQEVKTCLPILSPGRPGPPEMIGGHEPTNFYAAGIHNYQGTTNVLMPLNLGRLYYQNGYEQHKLLFLNLLNYVYPQVGRQLITTAPPRVEIVPQEFMYNTPEVNINSPFNSAGHIVHFVNLTGFSGNTYFPPLDVQNTDLKLALDYQPRKVWNIMDGRSLPFRYEDGYLVLMLPHLGEYAAVVIER